MRYKQIALDNNIKSLISVIIPSILLVFLIICGLKSLILSKNNSSRYSSVIYIKLLNNSMPVVKALNYDNELDTEESVSIRSVFLELLDLDIYDPISIMSKEITFFNNASFNSLLSNEDKGESNSDELSVNPFSLQDGQVFKGSSASERNGDNSGGTDDALDLPNRVVQVENPILKKSEADPLRPQILIYHTHTQESFEPNGNYTSDFSKNMVAVGDSLMYELETDYGIGVIHDKTIHDSVFNQAYHRSRETVNSYIKKYGDFKLIIDLHRDAVYSRKSVTMKMNGENVSKIMFVLTRKNPHFDKNSKVASSLMKISDNLFPGFNRGIHYFNYGSKYFNQDLSNNAVLIEVGAQVSTVEEVENSAQYIARIIAEYINGKS